eukprot:scaffold34555_cov48-Phaeocystis_antarctica.AAC.2
MRRNEPRSSPGLTILRLSLTSKRSFWNSTSILTKPHFHAAQRTAPTSGARVCASRGFSAPTERSKPEPMSPKEPANNESRVGHGAHGGGEGGKDGKVRKAQGLRVALEAKHGVDLDEEEGGEDLCRSGLDAESFRGLHGSIEAIQPTSAQDRRERGSGELLENRAGAFTQIAGNADRRVVRSAKSDSRVEVSVENLGEGEGGGANGEDTKDPATAGCANDEVDVKDADGLAGEVGLRQIMDRAGEDRTSEPADKVHKG